MAWLRRAAGLAVCPERAARAGLTAKRQRLTGGEAARFQNSDQSSVVTARLPEVG